MAGGAGERFCRLASGARSRSCACWAARRCSTRRSGGASRERTASDRLHQENAVARAASGLAANPSSSNRRTRHGGGGGLRSGVDRASRPTRCSPRGRPRRARCAPLPGVRPRRPRAEGAGALVTLGVQPTAPETATATSRSAHRPVAHIPGCGVASFMRSRRSRRRAALVGGRHLWNAASSCGAPTYPRRDRAVPNLLGRSRRARTPEPRCASAPTGAPKLRSTLRCSSAAIACDAPVALPLTDVGTGRRSRPSRRSGQSVGRDRRRRALHRRGRQPGLAAEHIALFGVVGLAVIDAGDALLVTRLDRSGAMKRVVAVLRARGRRDLL